MGTPIYSWLVRNTGKTTWSLQLASKVGGSFVGLSLQPVGSDLALALGNSVRIELNYRTPS